MPRLFCVHAVGRISDYLLALMFSGSSRLHTGAVAPRFQIAEASNASLLTVDLPAATGHIRLGWVQKQRVEAQGKGLFVGQRQDIGSMR